MSDVTAVTTRNYCRACSIADVENLSALVPLLTLGPVELSCFPAPGDRHAHPPVPLTLMACPRCTLVQLLHTTPFEWMFGSTPYWYRSGVNEMMRKELQSVVDHAYTAVGGLLTTDVVLDIGANDGTLLETYSRSGPYRIACEPSRSLHDALRHHCQELHADPFPCDALSIWEGKVKVITACAMIYDLDDPIRFFEQVERLLTPDGVCVVQFQDLMQMVERTAFDCICHEHLEYYTLYALANLLNHCGLWVTDVETREINGGSLRVTIRRKGHSGTPEGLHRVFTQIEREISAGYGTIKGLQGVHLRLAWRMDSMRRQVVEIIAKVVREGGSVDLYGASTKGNTLLQYLGLDRRLVRQAWERSEEKVGREVGYTRIPIVDEVTGRLDPPSLLLVPVWQFREAVIQREQDYLRVGGAMLFPLPHAELVQMRQAAGAEGGAGEAVA